MSETMVYPEHWWTFVQDYQIKDTEDAYTNGAMLVPVFRVRQMVEHYFGGSVGHESNYERLFGTPERAARTLEWMELDQINWCTSIPEGCRECPYEFDRYGCEPKTETLLEWLKSEVTP